MATTVTAAPPTGSELPGARTTGLLYLGIAITGMLGFLLVRPQLVDVADAAATLELVADRATLARVGVALDLGVVAFQALAAVAFHRLLRGVDALAAGALAAFGLVNATVLLVGAGAMHAAIEVAVGGTAVADAAGTVQLLFAVSAAMWDVGSLFFGLWLLPMGLLARRSSTMPDALGTVLLVGGVGYVLSTLVLVLLPGAQVVADVLILPATVGEFWMIGHLLRRGSSSA